MSPLNVEEEGHEGKRRPNFPGHESFKRSSVDPVGLRILTQFSHGESNLVLKSACRLRVPTPPPPSGASPESCFLKSCYLCNKELTPDKDIYMRGDEGFCSVECRNRQIVMDETKEIETSTKKILASSRHCRSAGGCETCVLLEDLRRRRKPISRHKNQALVS
ncbi:FCS-Like Zinc finger 17-like [Vitis riparia]|uniref:FCS-Like Zinc finger 17-like n=1 Tax=Vitis riparia TaxID=96939 RepID=UPI00155A0948|nr:FCS-Like Zinc finger 17-like [Vitis riparia]